MDIYKLNGKKPWCIIVTQLYNMFYYLCICFLSFMTTGNLYAKQAKSENPNHIDCSITDYILIDGGSHISSNFDFVPKHIRFTLIGTKELIDDLTPMQRQAFDRIITVADLNFEKVLKAIKSNINNYQTTRLLTIEESLSLMVAQIREILHIPGANLYTMLPFCDKLESKRRLNHAISFPKFIEFDYKSYSLNPNSYISHVIDKIGFPLIVKPTNLSGAHGIQKIDSLSALTEWCKNYQGTHAIDSTQLSGQPSNFEFEEYIDPMKSDLFHCDSIIQNGKITFTQVFIYTHPVLAVKEGKPIGSFTLSEKDYRYKALSKLPKLVIQAFCKYAPIPDGVMHLEAFYNNDTKRVIFLETQLRPPGLETPLVYKIYLNMDIEAVHWKLQMGLPIDDITVKKGPFAMWLSIPTRNGTIASLILPKEIKSTIHRLHYRIEKGDETTLPEALTLCDHCKKIALRVLISNEDYNTILSDFNYLKSFQPFHFERSGKQ